MKVTELSPEHVLELCLIYRKHCGSHAQLERIIENREDAQSSMAERIKQATFENRVDYRLGSRWSDNSDMRIMVDYEGHIVPGFNPRVQPNGNLVSLVAAQAGFAREAKAYLARATPVEPEKAYAATR